MISAKFVADFTQFAQAVDRAELKLTDLRSESGRVEKQLTRMGDSFSGKKIFADAELASKAVEGLGGVSKLTANEQSRLNGIVGEAISKYKALGQDAPKHLTAIADATKPVTSGFSSILGALKQIGPALGLAFSVGGIVSFSKGIADFSGKMLDLEAQTRITTSRLQAFDFVGGDVDLTIEDITTSADQLAKRLGGDDKSVNDALKKLHLSGEQLKQQDLDEVMFQIDEALVGVGNSMDRARILTDLFGRSGQQLGRLMDGSLRQIIKTAEETGPIIDREILQKADRFGEMWEHGWKRFQAAAVTAIDFVSKGLDQLLQAAEDVGRAMREDRTSDFGTPTTSPNITPRTGPARRAPRNITLNSTAADLIQGSGIGTLLQSNDHLETAIKKADDSFRDLAFTVESIATDMSGTGSMLGSSLMGKFTAAPKNPLFHGILGALDPRSLMFGPRDISGSAQGLPAGIGMGPGALAGLFGGGGGGTSGGGGGFLSRITGGLFGGGKGLSGLSNMLTGSLGNVLSGGLSSLISGGIGLLTKGISKLFGAEGKQTNRSRDAAISDFTGITGDKGASQDKFREMADAAGVAAGEVDRLLSTSKTKDFEAGFDRITKSIEASQAVLQKYSVSWQDFEGTERAKQFGEEIETLVGDTKTLEAAGLSHEGALKKQEQAYLDLALAGVKAGEEMTPALASVVKQLAEMGRVTDEQARMLLGLADSTTVDFQRMEDVAKKYGIEISALGPRFQEAKLGFSANETIKDFNFLIDSGADVNGVLAGMTDEMQALVKQSIDFGIALPDAMKPVLQKLLEQGSLTDASGTKLEDLSQIKFAPPIEESIQRLIDKMGELIDRIGGVGKAITDLPTVPSSIVDPNKYTQPDLGPAPLQMAEGGRGRVTQPTLFMAGVKGPEDFAFSGENRSFGGSDPALLDEMRDVNNSIKAFMRVLPIAMRDAVLLAR